MGGRARERGVSRAQPRDGLAARGVERADDAPRRRARRGARLSRARPCARGLHGDAAVRAARRAARVANGDPDRRERARDRLRRRAADPAPASASARADSARPARPVVVRGRDRAWRGADAGADLPRVVRARPGRRPPRGGHARRCASRDGAGRRGRACDRDDRRRRRARVARVPLSRAEIRVAELVQSRCRVGVEPDRDGRAVARTGGGAITRVSMAGGTAVPAAAATPHKKRDRTAGPDARNRASGSAPQCSLRHPIPALRRLAGPGGPDSAKIGPCAPLPPRPPCRLSSTPPVAPAARRARPFRSGWPPDEPRHSAGFRRDRVPPGTRPVRDGRDRHHDTGAVRAADRHHREFVQLRVARSAARAMEPRAQIGVDAGVPQQQSLRGERARRVAARPVQALLELQGRPLRRHRACGR